MLISMHLLKLQFLEFFVFYLVKKKTTKQLYSVNEMILTINLGMCCPSSLCTFLSIMLQPELADNKNATALTSQ